MEGGERGRRREYDENREHKEQDERAREHEEWERQRELDEFIEQRERDEELNRFIDERTRKEAQEKEDEKEQNKEYTSDEGKPEKEVKKAVEGLEKEEEQERREREEKEEQEVTEQNKGAYSDQGEPKREVKEAVKELEEQEEERRQEREYQEAEQEETRKERAETADNYDELEQWVMDTLEKHGANHEEVKKRWEERFREDVKDELEREENKEEREDKEDEKTSGEGKPQEGYNAHDDGSGQMYMTKHEGSEASESKQEMEAEKEEQEGMQNETSEKPRQEGREDTDSSEVEGEVREPQKEGTAQEPETKSAEEKTEETQERKEDFEKELSEPSEKAETSKEDKKTKEKTTPTQKEEDEKTSEETKEQEEESESEESTTKKRLEDHEPSPMFPKGLQERGTMIPESKEERWEKWLESEFKKLTEEEKEEFREAIRALLENQEDLERLIKKHGLEHLLEDEDTREELYQYINFRERLKEEIETGLSEEEAVYKVSQELELDVETASDWAQYESLPTSIKEITEREGHWVWSEGKRVYFEILYPQSKEELAEFLEGRTGITERELEVLDAWFEIKSLWKKKEIEFALKDGTPLFRYDQIKKLSEKYNIPEEVVRGWLRGILVPPRIREYTQASIEAIYAGFDESIKFQNSTNEIRISIPIILGTPIHSDKELKSYIERNVPGFLKRKDLRKILKSAKSHFMLREKYKHSRVIKYSEIEELSEEMGLAINTIKKWLLEGTTPMIYNMIENSISVDTAQQRIQDILNQLNGLENWSDVSKRLKTLYMYDLLKFQASFEGDVEHAKSYFRFIKKLRKGGVLPGIARRARVSIHQVNSWYYNDITPRLIRIARRIPAGFPERGKRWLPLKMNPGQDLSDFIQVPLRIQHPTNLYDVLAQLSSLNSSQMSKWNQRFGEQTQVHAMMYFLGTLFSDGSFSHKNRLSVETRMSLGKVYYWSETMGEAFCYSLGSLGFFAERRENSIRTQKNGKQVESLNWGSGSSPFFVWVKGVLFGIQQSQTKSNTPIQADWILKMSEDNRIAFIQGVSDGDGHVELASAWVDISSKKNQAFLKGVLESLGIKSRDSKSVVLIEKGSEIKKAASLPFFRHASERQRKLNELVKMLNSPRGGKLTDSEREDILRFEKEGLSSGKISLKLWKKNKVYRRPQVIREFLKKKKTRGIK